MGMGTFGKIGDAISTAKRVEAKIYTGPIDGRPPDLSQLQFGDFATSADQLNLYDDNLFVFGVHKWGDRNNRVV